MANPTPTISTQESLPRNDIRWINTYQRLVRYKKEHGNCLVPTTYKADPSLGGWVSMQRRRFRQGALRKDRKALLDHIGFEYDWYSRGNGPYSCTSLWEDRYQELLQFRREYGHCNVPTREEAQKTKYKGLSLWVYQQRRRRFASQEEHKYEPLTNEEIAKLDAVGFVWKPYNRHDEKWDDKFHLLEEYKRQFGDCDVPQDYAPDVQLGTWVAGQRREYKNQILRKDRIARLEALGFNWFKRPQRKPSIPQNNPCDSPTDPIQELQQERPTKVSPTADGPLDSIRVPPMLQLPPTLKLHSCSSRRVVSDHDIQLCCNNKAMDSITSTLIQRIGQAQRVISETQTHAREADATATVHNSTRSGFQNRQATDEQTTLLQDDSTQPKKPVDLDWIGATVASIMRGEQDSEHEQEASRPTEDVCEDDDDDNPHCVQPAQDSEEEQTPLHHLSLDKAKVGDRVAVYWADSGEYYPGTIASQKPPHDVLVHYDDGETKWHDVTLTGIKQLEDTESEPSDDSDDESDEQDSRSDDRKRVRTHDKTFQHLGDNDDDDDKEESYESGEETTDCDNDLEDDFVPAKRPRLDSTECPPLLLEDYWVGDQIGVYWPEDDRFHSGFITEKRPPNQICVDYDNGVMKWHEL